MVFLASPNVEIEPEPTRLKLFIITKVKTFDLDLGVSTLR